MSGILKVGDKQKFIAEKKEISSKDNVVEYEIKVNGAIQKEVYEALYKEKAKDVEIKGFRKGHAPREQVEPKIYSELVDSTVNFLVNYAVAELLEENKDDILIGKPELVDYAFSVVESPMTFKVRIYKAPNLKLPKLDKYKKLVKEADVTVSNDEVEVAIKQIFEDWLKKANKKDKEKFEKPSDEWVKSLDVPGITTLEQLKERVKADIEHSKLHEHANKTLQEIVGKIVEELNITVPKEYLDKQADLRYKQEEEGVKRYGITMEQYLQYYKKTPEQFKEELKKDLEAKIKEEAFWNLYIKEKGIEVDIKSQSDQVYLNYAVSALRLPQDVKLDQAMLAEIIKLARMYKAVEHLQGELGLHVHTHTHTHDEKESSNKEEKNDDTKASKEEKKDKTSKKSKILVPGQD